MAGRWLTMADYARKAHITHAAVRKAVQAGRLESNGKPGRECRVRGPMAETARIELPQKGPALASLADAKLEKLKADIELQRQKITVNSAAVRRACMEATVEEYVKAFAPLKARLISLRLEAKQLASLREIIDSCTESFRRGMEQRMNADEAVAH